MEYPRYDRGLGMMLTSEKHRQEVCKEPWRFGLPYNEITPVEGDFDEMRLHREQWAAHDELVAKDRAHKRDLEEHPDFRDYRRLRDKGYFEDLKKERREAAMQEA